MSNPFIGQETTAPQAPSKDNPFLTPATDSHSDNPFLTPIKGEERQPTLPELIAKNLVVEPLKKVSGAMYYALTGNNPGEHEVAPVVGDVASTRAFAPNVNPPSSDVMEGTALLASFLGGPAVESIPAAGPLLGKWGSFLTGEFLGGGIYGAVRPTDDDESRASAILGDAATFAAFGGTVRGAGEIASWALKRHILRMPPASRDRALTLAKAALDKVETDLANGGVTLDQLPSDAAAKLEEPILRQAVQDADPSAVNVDAIISAEASRAIEIAPRLDQPSNLRLEPPTEVKFKEELGKAKVTPMAGTTRGFEVTGKSKTPPVPARGKTLADLTGATMQQELREKIEAGRAKLATHTAETILPEVKEHLVAPTVRGKSGKLYVGGSTHPETIQRAIDTGVPEAEFEGVGPDSPNRGFKTNTRDFVSREEASKLVGHPEPLISEDMHQRGLLPHESLPVAEMNLENVAKQVVTKSGPEAEAALMDAATDHAVSQLEPVRTATPPVKEDAKLVADEIHKLPKRSKKQAELVSEVLTAALNQEGPAVEKSVLLNLTEPSPEYVGLEKAKARTPHEQNRIRKDLARSLEREKPAISLEPHELVQADLPGPESPTLPKELDGLEIGGRLPDSALVSLTKAFAEGAKGRGGFIQGRALIAITGSAMEWLSLNDNQSDSAKVTLRTLGGLMLAASLGPKIAESLAKTGFVRRILDAYNPELTMNAYPKGKEASRRYLETLMEWKQIAHEHGVTMDATFPDEGSNRAAMFVMDEGPSAPEWHNLTPAQQREAMGWHQLNLRLGQIGKAAGILKDYQENYVRHLLPPESFDKWRTTGYRILPVTGAFAKERILSLRGLEEWAKKQGIPGPLMKMSTVHGYHLAEFSRSLAAVRLKSVLEKVGLIVDVPKSSHVAFPEGWRPIGVLNLSGKMAPEPIAKALESISSPRSTRNELVNALDAAKSLWMRSIMMWFWEHGFNAMRSVVNLATNPAAYGDIYRYMKSTEGLEQQAARHGLNLYNRPDYGVHAHEQFQYLVRKLGMTPGPISGTIDRLLEKQDRLLWDKMIPFLQKFTYATEMHKFTEKTGGKFLEGSPEFTTAARKAADFANTVAGRVPRDLQDPELARGMRLLMFSPQWTMSRISLIANAAGEASEIMAGRLNYKDAAYLPFKMRQLAWGIGITYLGSKLLSGKPPAFNDQSSKFYMKTGLRGADGREIGLDVVGWWQDDNRLFNKPLDFVYNRLNPAIKLTQETISGRDYLGRSMTAGQRIGNLFTSFGPPAEAISDVARLASGRPVRGGEALQMGSRATGAFRTATIPRPMDVAISKYARKILTKQGIPANDDNVFELSRLLRGNLMAGNDMIDDRVINYLAYHRRGEANKHPLASKIPNIPDMLWQESRRVLADF